MTTYERIQNAAKKRGMNLRQVAKAAGMKSETAIYRYNQGVTPRESTLRAIADVLGVSVDYLLGNTDEMHPKQADASSKPTVVNLDEALQDKGMVMKFNGKDLSDTAKRGILNILEMLEEGKNDSK